jgi:hypothetical protein
VFGCVLLPRDRLHLLITLWLVVIPNAKSMWDTRIIYDFPEAARGSSEHPTVLRGTICVAFSWNRRAWLRNLRRRDRPQPYNIIEPQRLISGPLTATKVLWKLTYQILFSIPTTCSDFYLDAMQLKLKFKNSI